MCVNCFAMQSTNQMFIFIQMSGAPGTVRDTIGSKSKDADVDLQKQLDKLRST